MDFSQVLGQAVVVDNLKKQLEHGRVVHAYLFSGPKGIGKTLLATIFARGLLCSASAGRPCGQCSSCRRFDTGNHPDFKHIQPIRNSIHIDAVRELQRDIAVKPFHHGRKVYLIDDVHLMTTQAQNALLKTLEEPTGYGVILMTADAGIQLLPTVLSRCQQVILKPVPINLLEQYLQGRYKAPAQYIAFAAAYSHGIVGRAVNVIENENFQGQREEMISLIHNILSGDSTSMIKNADFFVDNKDKAFEIMDFIILWMRDIIMLKEWPSGVLINLDKRDMLAKDSINFTTDTIKYIINIVEETKQLLLGNSNFRLSIEVMLLRIQEVVACQ